MDELKVVAELLQGASSPATVLLAIFAWNLSKQLKEFQAKFVEKMDAFTNAQHEVDKRLALVEHELELDGNGNGGVTTNHRRRG